MRLRCWARTGDSEFCLLDAGHRDARGATMHDSGEHHKWGDACCPDNASATGRETAALRILEVSHEIDRVMFLAGEHSTDAVRAIAARLMVGTRASRGDQLEIATWLTMNEGAVGCHELLRQAADLLRPFAVR